MRILSLWRCKERFCIWEGRRLEVWDVCTRLALLLLLDVYTVYKYILVALHTCSRVCELTHILLT